MEDFQTPISRLRTYHRFSRFTVTPIELFPFRWEEPWSKRRRRWAGRLSWLFTPELLMASISIKNMPMRETRPTVRSRFWSNNSSNKNARLSLSVNTGCPENLLTNGGFGAFATGRADSRSGHVGFLPIAIGFCVAAKFRDVPQRDI
jgi:hypothetical protein